MTDTSRRALSLLAFAALCLVVASAGGQATGASPSSNTYEDTVEPMVNVLTHEGTGEAMDVMQKSVERAKQVQEDLQAGVESALAGKSGAARRAGKKLIEESKEVTAEYAKEISWLEKLKKLAQTIDVVSTGAKAAGYLAEGDPSGATHVMVDDLCKKVCAAGGAAALAWIPGVGSIAGAALGEEGYKKYVKPLLDKREQELREKAAKDAQLGQWLPREKVMDGRGNVRELEPDMYFDRASGLIKRRSPEEQARWEEVKRREFFDGRKLQAIHADYLNGKLPQSEFYRALEDFKRRDPTKVWEPPKLEYNAAATADAAPPSASGILDHVKAQRVTASGGDSSGTLTLTFWNVGSLAPGHGDASAVTTHQNGTETARGSFSGGPNGTFVFSVDGETMKLRLVDGKTVSHELGTLTVQNPGAFDNWPSGF